MVRAWRRLPSECQAMFAAASHGAKGLMLSQYDALNAKELGRWTLLLMLALGTWNVVNRCIGIGVGRNLSSNSLIEGQRRKARVELAATAGLLLPFVLVVLDDRLAVPVGELIVGSLIPGLLMSGAIALYVVVISAQRPELAALDTKPACRRSPPAGW